MRLGFHKKISKKQQILLYRPIKEQNIYFKKNFCYEILGIHALIEFKNLLFHIL